jgi:tetratricopeptide (TPR) repeat protein
MQMSRIEALVPGIPRQLRQGYAILILSAAAFAAGCIPGKNQPPKQPVVERTPKPFGLARIIEIHSRPHTPDRLINRAHAQCIDFFVDPAAEAYLRQNGVDNEIVQELKQVCVDARENPEERRRRAAIESRIGRPAAVEQYIAVARAYMSAGRFGPAQGEILEAIRLDESSELYFMLGRVAVEQRRCDFALQALESATLLKREMGYFAHASAGRCFQLVREWKRAHDAYQRALLEWDNTLARYPQILDNASPLVTGREWLLARIAEVQREL